jgi:hypothetical protein
VNRSDLADALGPVPMGKNVHHAQLGTPAGLIDIEAILFKAGELDDPEIRAAGGHSDFSEFVQLFLQARLFDGVGKVQEVAGLAVVRRRFAEIIKAGPDTGAGLSEASRSAAARADTLFVIGLKKNAFIRGRKWRGRVRVSIGAGI